ncbi:MAG: Cation-transporting ATPase pacS [Dactylosporangium sp.]|jgi:copper chaperone|nr:Cation-transporting ATPase pacS [Dactylosporangium sp.]
MLDEPLIKETTMATTTYTVSGMTCGHCVNAVTSEIQQLEGVRDVQVDLASGAVTVTSEAPLDDAAVAAAVDEAGYQVVS